MTRPTFSTPTSQAADPASPAAGKQTPSPELRLVGRGPHGSVTMRFAGGAVENRHREYGVETRRAAPDTQPGLAPTDPRWVLAVRTQQVLQGSVLRPADRADLLRVGKVMGLNPFDANLVIAIVQDQARRGGTLQGAAGSLSRVPAGKHPGRPPVARRVLTWSAAILAAELLIIWAII